MKGKVTSTGKIPGLGGKSMVSTDTQSGKAVPGGGKSMVQNLPKVSGKATGSGM
jgi:hypothetical protein